MNILNLCITFNFINGIVKEPVQLELQPNPSKWNQVKKVSQRFASTTTVYGLTRVMKADSLFMKIVWALMTLLSLSVGSHSHSQCLKGIFKIWCRHTDKAHLPTVYFIAFGNILLWIEYARINKDSSLWCSWYEWFDKFDWRILCSRN